MREGTFHPLSFFDQIFVSLILIKNFQIFLELKIDINLFNLAIESYKKGPLGGAKDEHLSFFIAHAN